MAPKYERLTPEREEHFRDWARCHETVHPIDALRLEIEEARKNNATCAKCGNKDSK
jgi:hypothetical protein